jgi:hypothetical protein
MAVETVGFARTSVTKKGLIMEDDKARAVRWYHDDQGDVNALAAEFAAVRMETIKACADACRTPECAAAIRAMNEKEGA